MSLIFSTVACNATLARHICYVNYISPFPHNVSLGRLWFNHFASFCLSKSQDKKGVNCVDECSDDGIFIGCITSVNSLDTREWCENLKIEGKVAKVQLDTGA